MLPRRTRQILTLLCAVCHLTLTFPTQIPTASDEVQRLRVKIPHSGGVSATLGSSIFLPCFVSLSSTPPSTPSSASPTAPRIKWTVVSGGVETQILVVRGSRVKVNEAYRDRAALLNYTSSPDDLSLWLGDLRSNDSGHYRCEVQQGLEDASDLIQLKVKGVVFHYRDALGRYAFSFHQAQRACEAIGAQIATPDQLLAAYYDGYEQCDAGWLADQSVRYPIQVPREGCYGDMNGQPGVRNYGTMNGDQLFDVYCYVEQIDGEVFHSTVPQLLSFDEAQSYCRAAGGELATTAQLYLAWSEGLDRCSPGWLSDGSVRYPIITPRERCGGPQAGVKTVYRFSNQTGFPEASSLHDVYCFRENRNMSTDSPMDYMATESEDIGHDIVILMDKDQELQLNQQVEQVEREAQSVLESLPYFTGLFTEETLVDTHPTVISDTTESPLSPTSTLEVLEPFDNTPSPTEMSYNSQPPTALTDSTISSTETYSPPQNTSFLQSVNNVTDSHQNLSFTFQSELEPTTYEPHTENQTVPDSNLDEDSQPSETPKPPKEPELNFDRSQASYNETDSSNRTQEETLWEVTRDPVIQTTLEEAAAEDKSQMLLTTQASTEEEEGTLLTQPTQSTRPTIEVLTSMFAQIDGSGDVSEESSLDMEAVSFFSTSASSTSGFTTHLTPSALASGAPHPTLPSGSRHFDKLGMETVSTSPQLWETTVSRQEGSTSLEIEDTLVTESEEKELRSTKSDQLISGVSSATTESPEYSNTSHLPNASSTTTTTEYHTSNYRVYLDTVTSSHEEGSGQEPTTFKEDAEVSPTLEDEFKFPPTLEEEGNGSFSLENGVELAPTLILPEEANVSSTFEKEARIPPILVHEKEANISSKLEEEADVPPTLVYTDTMDVTSTYDGEASISTMFDEEANTTSKLEDDVNAPPTLVDAEDANVSLTHFYEKEANISSKFEDEVKVSPTFVDAEDTDVELTLSYDQEANISKTFEEETNISSKLEDDINVPPTLVDAEDTDVEMTVSYDTGDDISQTTEEDASISSKLEEEASVSSTPEEFTIIPLNSQTSTWALLTTTTGPQESLNELEYSQETSSTAATDSSLTTTSTAADVKTTTTPITTTTTTTHWSRRTWSPTTTTPRVFHKTAEPQKVTHVIPPVGRGLADVEISLTQPPTLLILPNERAAVGGAGKSSDPCLDDPCRNGGTCTDQGGQVKCLCLPTYGGNFCQIDLERCEPGWDKFQGFCYQHFSQRLSWEVAEQQCRTMGAHLVSIMTPEEQNYINNNYKEYQWTGLNDKTVEDDFHWSDGNPLLYENWYRGQPDSYFLSGEDCVVMVWHDNGRWSDVPCNYHLAYTCKKGTSFCGPPPKVRNTSIFGKARQRYETHAVIRYRCAEGFQQRLKPLIRCLPEGRWERPQILCIPEAGGLTLPLGDTSLADSHYAAAEDEFEATTETPQYWDIKF
ncbi:brevican core protein-like [Mugil cephalus]|uniref:brevican core protein-like n=1 Tax=Mugil cephalus TaxID=48193 RepID=UPI001FB6CEB5|nr:brevican core protein-like [Mugil cephalus]